MSMPTNDNPHTVRKSGYELVYWCGIEASGPEGATRVVVYQNFERSGRFHVGEFMLPSQNSKLETLEIALAYAFAQGRKDKARELRKALEI